MVGVGVTVGGFVGVVGGANVSVGIVVEVAVG